jgi:monoamine oxidase
MGFVLAKHFRECESLTVDERKSLICQQYALCFNDERFLQPVAFDEQNWNAEEFSRGCYFGNFPTGLLTECGRALREPVGLIHWAGTETSVEWMGYMEGAVRSGKRAAAEVLAKLNK